MVCIFAEYLYCFIGLLQLKLDLFDGINCCGNIILIEGVSFTVIVMYLPGCIT